MKVVFDKNILVSTLAFPGGRGEAALRRIIEEEDRLVISKRIIDELLGILRASFRAMLKSSPMSYTCAQYQGNHRRN